ncbi:MAG: adenine phosphoribosyltransferase [Myxococcota bacterium]
MSIKSLIRTVSDYPRPGIQFRDITSLLRDAKGLRIAVDGLCEPYRADGIEKIVGIEARGFLFGVSVALQLEAGFVPVRKAGKLPAAVIGREYELEYGSDRVEVHADALAVGERVLVVDDLIATGGTATATVELIRDIGAEVVGCAFVIDLPDLGGSSRLEDLGLRVTSLCAFEGE